MNEKILKCWGMALRAHKGQTDKQGQPYIRHVIRVQEAVPDLCKCVAILHDVIEDSYITEIEVMKNCNLFDSEKEALLLLTKKPGQQYNQYIKYLMGHEKSLAKFVAREVKIADLHDNLGRIPPEPDPFHGGAKKAREYDNWIREWSGLKRRYERSLRALEPV